MSAASVGFPARSYSFAKSFKAREANGGAYVTFLLLPNRKAGTNHASYSRADMQIAWAECFRELVRLGYTLDYVRPVMEHYAKKWIDRRYCEICAPIIKT